MKLILISGGVSSGKSAFAEKKAQKLSEKVLYVASAVALDDEMTIKIEQHQLRRPKNWDVLEIKYDLPFNQIWTQNAEVILFDSITSWLSHFFYLKEKQNEAIYLEDPHKMMSRWLDFNKISVSTMIIVTDEIGFGGIALTSLGRAFQRCLGELNQYIANQADEYYVIFSGMPLQLK